jgi:hypothetical protein
MVVYSLNQPLVNPHLIHIPGLTTLSTRRLARRDLQTFRRQAHGSLDAQILGFRTLDEFLADFFKRRNFSAGQGDADFVGFGGFVGFFVFLVRHFGGIGLGMRIL